MPISPVWLLLGAANGVYAVLNGQLVRGLDNLGKKSRPKSGSPRPKVSVLIAARNEEFRIRKCLECLAAQDYPRELTQILVVDDRSTDGTAGILDEYVARVPGFQYLSVSEKAAGISPKKNALSQGLRLATGEIIITTDADCIMAPQWISSLISEFGPETGLVSGLTTYYDAGPGVWNGVQALEFFSYAVVAAALIGLNFPVNGNANNLAYRREVFDQVSGFASHGGIVSGDDDFLIQAIHKQGRWAIRYAVTPESQVRTEPPEDLRQFWEQRKRWASKCGLYQPKQVAFLALIFAYYLSIPLFVLAGLYYRPWLYVGLAGFAVKTVSDGMVMRRAAKLFGKQSLMRAFLPAALLHIPLIIAAVAAGSFGEFTWKGETHRRKVKVPQIKGATAR
ncbi:MAG: glycosyltransferase [Fibrobacteres bacterium]|nr:glycosyltransferase [Fibrobacterota bacterium]